MTRAERFGEALEGGVHVRFGRRVVAQPAPQVAAGQGRGRGPCAAAAIAGIVRAASAASTWSAACSASLRKVVILPPHTDSSGAPPARVELEPVVARDRGEVARLVVEQRPHAAVGPDDLRPA